MKRILLIALMALSVKAVDETQEKILSSPEMSPKKNFSQEEQKTSPQEILAEALDNCYEQLISAYENLFKETSLTNPKKIFLELLLPRIKYDVISSMIKDKIYSSKQNFEKKKQTFEETLLLFEKPIYFSWKDICIEFERRFTEYYDNQIIVGQLCPNLEKLYISFLEVQKQTLEEIYLPD